MTMSNCPALQKFLSIHLEAESGDDLRLGQRFCNMYKIKSWPELFYEQDPAMSIPMIEKWLMDHHYYDYLPGEDPVAH
jgi:hypothetical protein